MRLKGLILITVLILAAAGCAGPVKTELSAQYRSLSPYRIAVLPVIPEARALESDAAWLMRKFVYERLRSMDYRPVALEAIDEWVLWHDPDEWTEEFMTFVRSWHIDLGDLEEHALNHSKLPAVRNKVYR